MATLRWHKSLWITASLAVILGTAVVGCNSTEPLMDLQPATVAAEKVGPVPLDPVPFSMVFLDYLWVGSNHDDWDVISGMIDPVLGGRIQGVPESWPDDYVFGVLFPPGCLDSTEPFRASISVPRFVPGDVHPPVYLLEPHGVIFNTRLTVQFCYPYWYGQFATYTKFNFWPEETSEKGLADEMLEPTGGPDPIPEYFVSDFEELVPTERNKHLAHKFKTTHFSRWGMSHGDGGGEDFQFKMNRGHR